MEIINMPKVGNSVKTCLLTKFNFNLGEYINKGDILFSYETDKTQIDYKSEFSGYILKYLVEPGDEVEVFAPLIVIGAQNEDISQIDLPVKTNIENKEQSENLNLVTPNNTSIESTALVKKNAKNISPRAFNLAQDLNVNVNNITSASGSNHRIMSNDVIEYYHKNANKEITHSIIEEPQDNLEANKFNPQSETIPYNNVRIATQNHLMNAEQYASMSTISIECDASILVSVHKRLKEQSEVKITINDLLIFALSRVAQKYPQVNSISQTNKYQTFNYTSVSFALDRGNGLYVPVVKYASELSLKQIALRTKELIQKVNDNALTSQDMEGGTICISNVGNYGVKMFTPILNWPQSSIIGIGSIISKLIMRNEQVLEIPSLTLSLTFNHNTYDGLMGAKFLNDLGKNIENIDMLLITGGM